MRHDTCYKCGYLMILWPTDLHQLWGITVIGNRFKISLYNLKNYIKTWNKSKFGFISSKHAQHWVTFSIKINKQTTGSPRKRVKKIFKSSSSTVSIKPFLC